MRELEVKLSVQVLGCPASFVEFVKALDDLGVIKIVSHYNLNHRPEGNVFKFRIKPPMGVDSDRWLRSCSRRLQQRNLTAIITTTISKTTTKSQTPKRPHREETKNGGITKA